MKAARHRVDGDSGRIELGRRSRPASPAPDGPGAPPIGSPGYFDGGLGRSGYMASERCRRSTLCALYGGHGGDCDPRSEPERARALTALLDRGLEGEALTAAVEEEARAALRTAAG